MAINFTTPVGRIVQGELWKPMEQKDQKGIVKLGLDMKPLVDFYFALAIPKEPGHTHWAQTAWGRQVWDEGNRAHPNFAPHPTFSWKIEDGDSVIPNKKGKKNCDREGFPGNWILKLRSGFAIPTYNANGSETMPPEAFKTGHYAQVLVSVKGNTGDTPGVYLNPVMVALSGYGAEISNAPDASEAGFGQAPLPAGASAVPVATASLPVPGGAAVPTLPTLPSVAAVPALPSIPNGQGPTVPPVASSVPTSPSSIPVVPNPTILAGPRMTAKAGGATFEQFVAQGWTLDAMRAQGYAE